MKKVKIALALMLSAAIAAPMADAATTWASYRIMIDPGHGGSDSGALGYGGKPHEATLCLENAKKLKSIITAAPISGTVKLTRETDTYIALSTRKSMSVSYDPYIFCSIHLNAANKSAQGTETWYYHSTGNSKVLANKVHAKLVEQLGLNNRGVKQNGWTVITGSASVPAILTEGLFVDESKGWNMIKDYSTPSAGFMKWVNGHLYGFYQHLKNNLGKDVVNPESSGGSTVTTPTLTVSSSSLYFTVGKGKSASMTFTVKASNLTGAISVASSNSKVTVSPASFTKASGGGEVTVTFNSSGMNAGDFDLGKVITVKSASDNLTKTVGVSGKVSGVLLDGLTAKWNYSEKKGNATAPGYDATKIRNFCYHNGKLYCVYNHSEIKVINAQTGADLGNLNKGTDVGGGTLTFCDVKVIDGVIIACNLAATGQTLKLYAWENDQQPAVCIKEITDLRGASRLGDCMELSGSYNGTMYVTFANDTGGDTRIIEFTRTNGKSWSGTYYTVVGKDGSSHFSTATTTRAYKKSGGWWIDGKDSYPTWVSLSGSKAVEQYDIDTGESWGSSHHEFNWDGDLYCSNIVFNGKTSNTADNYKGAKARLSLVQTSNYSKTQEVKMYPAEGLGETSQNTNATADSWVNTDGSTYVELWVYSTTHGLAYYTYGNVPTHSVTPIVPAEPQIAANVEARWLQATVGESSFNFVDVTGANLKGDITATLSGQDASMFTITPSTIAQSAGSGQIKITYAPTEAGDHTATITLASTGANTVTVTLHGTATSADEPDPDDPVTEFDDEISSLENGWTFSTTANNDGTPGWLNTGSASEYTRDIQVLNGKLYVVNSQPYSKDPTVVIVDAYTGRSTGELNVKGVATEGVRVPLSGIATLGGKILASSSASSTHTFKVYMWDNDAAAPVEVISDATHEGISVGDQLNTSGDLNNGYLWVTNGVKVLRYKVTNGTFSQTAEVITLSNGSETTNGSADVCVLADGSFWVAGKGSLPQYYQPDGTLIGTLSASFAVHGTSIAVNDFGGRQYMAAITYVTPGTTLAGGAIALIDLTGTVSSMAKAAGNTITGTIVGIYPENGLGETRNIQFQTAVTTEISADGTKFNVWGQVPFQGATFYSYDGTVSTGVADVTVNDDLQISTFGGNIIALGDNIRMEVYTTSGSLVATSVNGQIDGSRLGRGVYIVRAIAADGHAVTRKLAR